MVHSFKLGGHRWAYDSGSRSLHILDELMFKMLDYIELPMPKDCPSALRYDLAKYDSAAIDSTYAELYRLYTEGKLYSSDSSTGTYAPEPADGAYLGDGTKVVASHSNPHIQSLDEYVGKLEIVPANSCADSKADSKTDSKADSRADSKADSKADGDALNEDDTAALIKELDRAAKPLVADKRNPFAQKEAFAHNCDGCWAKNICSLKCKSESLCTLERRRLEYQLVLEHN